MRTIWKALALCLAALLVLAGCGGGEASDAAETTLEATATPTPAERSPTESPTPYGPPEAQRYDSVIDLRDALTAAGYACPSWDAHHRVTLALQSGSCSDGDVLMIFTGEAAVQEASQELKAVGSTLVVGPNWIVNPAATPNDVRMMIGGIIMVGDPRPTVSTPQLENPEEKQSEYLSALSLTGGAAHLEGVSDTELLAAGEKACWTYDNAGDLQLAMTFASLELPDHVPPEGWAVVAVAAAYALCNEHWEDVQRESTELSEG